MHELAIALSILDVAAEEARNRGLGKVRQIHLRLGPLSGVVKEALLPAFELARATSPLTDATLVIEDMPILIACPRCRVERPVQSLQDHGCAVCGAPAEVTGGRELEIVALEVE
ncbi:MAG: hydrogenase maturation nickel metallochaperone HypA [Planctomycetes bacterium]|nr:hydrogenase maturation nickel metallochaperone HypA [Planctomycetota bacterium]